MDLEYFSLDENIHPLMMRNLYMELVKDDLIEIANELSDGRLSHIVLKGTNIPVGYLGDESLEFVSDKSTKLDSIEIIKGKERISEIYDKCRFKTLFQVTYCPN